MGHPEAIWDFEFDTIFPFSAKIRYKDIIPVEAGKYVLDTICVFPKESVSLEENRKLFSKLDTINDAEQFLSTVEENRLQYYEDTTWDVMQDK